MGKIFKIFVILLLLLFIVPMLWLLIKEVLFFFVGFDVSPLAFGAIVFAVVMIIVAIVV